MSLLLHYCKHGLKTNERSIVFQLLNSYPKGYGQIDDEASPYFVFFCITIWMESPCIVSFKTDITVIEIVRAESEWMSPIE